LDQKLFSGAEGTPDDFRVQVVFLGRAQRLKQWDVVK
jgi:hypothetical protein